MWYFKSLKALSNMSVSHARNVCQSQKNMQVIYNMFLLFPTAILVNVDNPSNFQDFLSFLIFSFPFKNVSKVTALDVCQSQKRVVIINYFLFLCFLKLTSFSIKTNLRSWAKPMHAFLQQEKFRSNTDNMAKI